VTLTALNHVVHVPVSTSMSARSVLSGTFTGVRMSVGRTVLLASRKTQ
jgi:hypothetical protein